MIGLHELQHLALCCGRKRRKISVGELSALGFVAVRPTGESAVVDNRKRDAVSALLAG